jgi:hypothetical protein
VNLGVVSKPGARAMIFGPQYLGDKSSTNIFSLLSTTYPEKIISANKPKANLSLS